MAKKTNETSRYWNQTRPGSIMELDLENMIVRLMFILKKKFPFPNDLRPADVNAEMFIRPNMQLMSSIVHYLLNIINPGKCAQLVPHPLSVQSIAHFHRGAMKFLTQTFHELPHVKIDGLRVSTLVASSGDRFIDFLARLVTNTVQLVYEKYGVVSVPSSIGVDGSIRLDIMQAKGDRATQELFQLRHPSAKNISVAPRYEEALQKLKITRGRLTEKYNEMVLSCPSPFREGLEGGGSEQVVTVLKSWKNYIEKSLDELSLEHQISQVWSNAIREDDELIGATREPTKLERDKILHSKNEPVILKVAEDQKIQLVDGSALYLPGFLRCTSAIAEKLNTLIVNSKLREYIELELALDTSLKKLLELDSMMDGDIVKTEEEINVLEKKCKELQRLYDSSEITYRYSYSRSFPSPHLKISASTESTDLTLSPGNSWKEELEDMKRKLHGDEGGSAVHITPKLSRKRFDNSSIINLSRTVLQKQAWASGSKGADFTVGEMFQGPLSSSSPVNSAGDHAIVPTRKSISDIIDDVSLLDSELDEFLADVSEMVDTGEASGDLSPDDAFGDSHPPELCQDPRERQASSQLQSPVERNAQGLSQVPEPLPPAASAKPIRRVRPSLDALVKRYASLREKMNQ